MTVRVESPLELDRRSIDRKISETEIERSRTVTKNEESRVSAGASVSFTPSNASLSLDGSAKIEKDAKVELIDKRKERLQNTKVSPIGGDRHTYSWELTPNEGAHLLGQPWHPVNDPRLAVKPLGRLPKLDPSISVTINCTLDDIIISDIEYKTPPSRISLDRIVPRNTTAVAVQHLKKLLIDADLEPGTLDDRFSRVILAMVLSCSE